MAGDTDRTIGNIEGKLDLVIGHLERQDKTSRESRKEMYERIDSVARSTEAIGSRVTAVETFAETARPILDGVKQWEQRTYGAMAVLSVAGGGAASFVIWQWDKIVTIFGV